MAQRGWGGMQIESLVRGSCGRITHSEGFNHIRAICFSDNRHKALGSVRRRVEHQRGAVPGSPVGSAPPLPLVARQIKSPHAKLLKKPTPDAQPIRQELLSTWFAHRASIHARSTE
jgi:hypothetical protein